MGVIKLPAWWCHKSIFNYLFHKRKREGEGRRLDRGAYYHINASENPKKKKKKASVPAAHGHQMGPTLYYCVNAVNKQQMDSPAHSPSPRAEPTEFLIDVLGSQTLA